MLLGGPARSIQGSDFLKLTPGVGSSPCTVRFQAQAGLAMGFRDSPKPTVAPIKFPFINPYREQGLQSRILADRKAGCPLQGSADPQLRKLSLHARGWQKVRPYTFPYYAAKSCSFQT